MNTATCTEVEHPTKNDAGLDRIWRMAWAYETPQKRMDIMRDSGNIGQLYTLPAASFICTCCLTSFHAGQNVMIFKACGHYIHSQCMNDHISKGNINCTACEAEVFLHGRASVEPVFHRSNVAWRSYCRVVGYLRASEIIYGGVSMERVKDAKEKVKNHAIELAKGRKMNTAGGKSKADEKDELGDNDEWDMVSKDELEETSEDVKKGAGCVVM